MKTKCTMVVSFIIDGDEHYAIDWANDFGEYLLTHSTSTSRIDQWSLQDVNGDLCWQGRND